MQGLGPVYSMVNFGYCSSTASRLAKLNKYPLHFKQNLFCFPVHNDAKQFQCWVGDAGVKLKVHDCPDRVTQCVKTVRDDYHLTTLGGEFIFD